MRRAGWRNPMRHGQNRQGFLGRSKTRRKSKARLYAGFCATRRRAVAVIPLGRRSRAGSSHLPAASPSRIAGCLFGVAPRRDCPFHPPASRLRASKGTRLCCSDPHLTVDRCYLLRRSAESGRSSRRRTCQRPPGGLCKPDSIEDSQMVPSFRRGARRRSRPDATATFRRCGSPATPRRPRRRRSPPSACRTRRNWPHPARG